MLSSYLYLFITLTSIFCWVLLCYLTNHQDDSIKSLCVFEAEATPNRDRRKIWYNGAVLWLYFKRISYLFASLSRYVFDLTMLRELETVMRALHLNRHRYKFDNTIIKFLQK